MLNFNLEWLSSLLMYFGLNIYPIWITCCTEKQESFKYKPTRSSQTYIKKKTKKILKIRLILKELNFYRVIKINGNFRDALMNYLYFNEPLIFLLKVLKYKKE